MAKQTEVPIESGVWCGSVVVAQLLLFSTHRKIYHIESIFSSHAVCEAKMCVRSTSAGKRCPDPHGLHERIERFYRIRVMNVRFEFVYDVDLWRAWATHAAFTGTICAKASGIGASCTSIRICVCFMVRTISIAVNHEHTLVVRFISILFTMHRTTAYTTASGQFIVYGNLYVRKRVFGLAVCRCRNCQSFILFN